MKKTLATLLCAAALLFAQPLRRAPGFCLIDTTGQWRDLADYQGKVVLVEFMKTDCPHCAAFSTVLNNLKSTYGEKLVILAIANPPDSPQTMLQFAGAHKIAYPLLLDQGQVGASYVRAASLDLPAVYLVDGAGMIRGSWQNGPLTAGIFEGNGLSREIDKLLGASAPARK